QANGGGGSISNNTITTVAGGNALNISAAYLGTISGNTASGGGFNVISVAPGTHITGAATWAQLGLPYVVSAGTVYGNPTGGGVYVDAGGSLTIQPGVVVKFTKVTAYAYDTAYLRVYGSLTANGTAAQPIIFTSYLDDAAAGDTNGDGSATTPAAGDWAGIRFETGSTGALSNAVIRYAGSTYHDTVWTGAQKFAGLDIATGSATQPVLGAGIQITDNITGIAVSGTATNLTVSGMTLARNGTTVQVNGGQVPVSDETITLSGPGTGVQVNGGTATITGNTISGGATGMVLSGGTATVSGNTIIVGTTGIQANAGGGSISNNTITTVAGGNALNISAAYLGTISGNTASGGGFN